MKTFDLTYLSFGAGLQSTALLVMSALRLRDVPKIDLAVFADTQGEPQWVYDHLKFMRTWAFEHGINIDVVTAGNLAQDVIDRHAPDQRRRRFGAVPCWTEGTNSRTGEKEAVPLRRQCTSEYKIECIERHTQRVRRDVRRMKTRAEFLARFEETLCGFGLYGVVIDSVHPDQKTMAHAARAMRVPERAAKLLDAMYRFLAEGEQPPKPAPSMNGTAKPEPMKART
jgi:hypothetical protein